MNIIIGVEGVVNILGDMYFVNVIKNILYFKGVGLSVLIFMICLFGLKFILFLNLLVLMMDYVIGMEIGNLWFLVLFVLIGFKWYSGMIFIGNMDGGGNLIVIGFVGCNWVFVVNLIFIVGFYLILKIYVDSLGYLIVGIGLIKMSGILLVNVV